MRAGSRPGLRFDGPVGLADQQRARIRHSSATGADDRPSDDQLHARAALREQAARAAHRRGGPSSAFAVSPEASGAEEEPHDARVVHVGKISASFTLPPERPQPEVGAALPPALKKQRKHEERRRREDGAAAHTSGVLQRQADALQQAAEREAEEALLSARGRGSGRLGSGLWERPAAEYHAPSARVATSGAAIGRIVEQVQTHNRLLQVDDMWRRHREEGTAAAAAAGPACEEREPQPQAADRSAEIAAAREEAVRRKLAAKAPADAGGTGPAATAVVTGIAGAAADDDTAGRKRDKERRKGKKVKSKDKKEQKERKRKHKHKKKRRRESSSDSSSSSDG